jgi:nitrous oxidase accessory protein NosD
LVIALALLGASVLGAPASATQPECQVANQPPNKKSYNSNTDADPLGAAIAEAAPGDTLQVIGTCHGNFVIAKDLILQGRSSAQHTDTLDGDASGPVLTVPLGVPADVTVSDLTVTGGGGGISALGPGVVTITDTHVIDNVGTGIGRFAGSGGVIIENSVVSGNSATSGGGIWNTIGGSRGMMISNSLVTNNTATFFGGGIFNRGTLAISDSTISSNVAGTDGGGIYNLHGVPINFTNVTLSGNSPNDYACGSFC